MTLSFVDSWLGGVTSISVRLFVTAGLLILAFGQGLIQPVQPVIIAGVDCICHMTDVMIHTNHTRTAVTFLFMYFNYFLPPH